MFERLAAHMLILKTVNDTLCPVSAALGLDVRERALLWTGTLRAMAYAWSAVARLAPLWEAYGGISITIPHRGTAMSFPQRGESSSRPCLSSRPPSTAPGGDTYGLTASTPVEHRRRERGANRGANATAAREDRGTGPMSAWVKVLKRHLVSTPESGLHFQTPVQSRSRGNCFRTRHGYVSLDSRMYGALAR